MSKTLKYIVFIILMMAGKFCLAQEIPFNFVNVPTSFSNKDSTKLSAQNNTKKVFNSSAYQNWIQAYDIQNIQILNIPNSLLKYQRMLLFTSSIPNYKLSIYSQMANLLQNEGNYQEAVQIFYKALSLANDETTQAKLYINISGLYITLKDYEKAMNSLNKAIQILQHDGNNYWLALAICNKGSIYNARNQFENALLEFRKAYRATDSITKDHVNDVQQKLDTRALVLNNIADSYMKLNMLDSALHFIKMALLDYNNLSKYPKCVVMLTMGQVSSSSGDNKTAIQYLKQGLKIGEKSDFAIMNKDSYQSLALLYSRIGNYKEAWINQKKYSEVNDQLISIENINKINTLERQYELFKKDKELSQKELLINNQKTKLKEQKWIAGILILTLALLCVLFLAFRKSHFNKQKLLKEQLKNNIKDRKIMQIEAGMKGEEKERSRLAQDLHDGVVSEMLAMKLNLQAMERNHKELRQSDDYKNILIQAEEVTDKLRMVAHNLMPANIREQGLIHTILAFLNRINNYKLQFTFLHYGKIPEFNDITIKIILMMTMELVQNILKHSKATEAIIQFNFFDDAMSITVEDNGIGITNDLNSKKGMGLTNIENNVGILNGTFDIKSSEYDGTTMLIEIPLNEHTLKVD